jgi:hypothetical protein
MSERPSKRARVEETEPVEQHDSGFMEPMQMFSTFPHNDTFIDNRVFTLNATPVDATPQTRLWYFKYRRCDNLCKN